MKKMFIKVVRQEQDQQQQFPPSNTVCIYWCAPSKSTRAEWMGMCV